MNLDFPILNFNFQVSVTEQKLCTPEFADILHLSLYRSLRQGIIVSYHIEYLLDSILVVPINTKYYVSLIVVR